MVQSRRAKLSAMLHQALGSNYVYYQPPSSALMEYPCVVYERDTASPRHADDSLYSFMQGYQVTYIDRNPDSDVIDRLIALPYSAFRRHFVKDNLYHDVFVIYI